MSENENTDSTSICNPENYPGYNENNQITPENLTTPIVTVQQPENFSLQDAPKDGATFTPRPIVVEMPANLTEKIKKIADNCDKNFKTNENWMKLIPWTSRKN